MCLVRNSWRPGGRKAGKDKAKARQKRLTGLTRLTGYLNHSITQTITEKHRKKQELGFRNQDLGKSKSKAKAFDRDEGDKGG